MKKLPNLLFDRLLQLWNDRAWRFAIAVFLITRLGISLWMWGVRQVIPLTLTPDPVLRPYLGVMTERNPWLEVWQRWDSLHYQAIAERGYKAFDSALFVPPLFPGLIRLAAPLFGGNTLAAGILISNVLYFACLISFFRLAMDELDDGQSASRAILYLASFPTAFFFLAAYTESLFFLAAILAIDRARKDSWVLAGFWGAVASLARLPGMLVFVPLAWAALHAWRQKGDRRAWIAPILALTGAGLFPLYVWLRMGLVPWTPLIIQDLRYHGSLAWPGANLLEAVRLLISGQSSLTNVLELVFTLLFLAGLVPVWLNLPKIYGIYYLTFIALYLTRMAGTYPLLGMTRYVLALFPLFLLLGKWGCKPWVNRLILYPSWILLLFMSGQFALWGWAG